MFDQRWVQDLEVEKTGQHQEQVSAVAVNHSWKEERAPALMPAGTDIDVIFWLLLLSTSVPYCNNISRFQPNSRGGGNVEFWIRAHHWHHGQDCIRACHQDNYCQVMNAWLHNIITKFAGAVSTLRRLWMNSLQVNTIISTTAPSSSPKFQKQCQLLQQVVLWDQRRQLWWWTQFQRILRPQARRDLVQIGLCQLGWMCWAWKPLPPGNKEKRSGRLLDLMLTIWQA